MNLLYFTDVAQVGEIKVLTLTSDLLLTNFCT